MNHSQFLSKPKSKTDHFQALNFHYTIQTYLFGEEGVGTDEKKRLLTEQKLLLA